MKRNFCFYVLMSLMLLGFSSTVESQFGDPVPRYPQEMDGPVNVINRALVFSETDIAIPGRGFGINFTRYYNSDGLHRSTGGVSYIGHKWSHSYQWEIRKATQYRLGAMRTTWSIITGRGSVQTFTQLTVNSKTVYRPDSGVRATLESDASGVFIYTTRSGISYRFEKPANTTTTKYVLTKISDPNGTRVILHYEAAPESYASSSHFPRLAAVEDSLGRLLTFFYTTRIDDYDYTRHISKVQFGVGTKTALTTVYQTVNYNYSRYGYYTTSVFEDGRTLKYFSAYTFLTAVTRPLGSGDPRGTQLQTQYEYVHPTNVNSYTHNWYTFGHMSAIVSPLGYRTEVDIYGGGVRYVRVRDVPPADSSKKGDLVYYRTYSHAHTTLYARPQSGQRHSRQYTIRSGQVSQLTRGGLPVWYWGYSGRNVTTANHFDREYSEKTYTKYLRKYDYRISYAGSNAAHNRQMGNPTKWEQYLPGYYTMYTDTNIVTRGTLVRKWEADYETKFNRPIWQIDSMGHKTTFTYDTKGNLTEQRSKANTGTQPHAVDHDIITKHEYDSYGNRIKTTFMPDTTQEKVVETVYDSTKHTYPIEAKTTVTVNGTKHTIKTKSEWDVNRGLKTADIDATGRRTEYTYWQDRKLKYTRRVTDNLYTIPTYDKNGNVTQTQVRKDNWQTGTLIAQTKTEYDAMNRAVKAHSFNSNNWTTPYATTETVYDIFGDVSQTKDPRGLITNYTRDRLGRVTKQTLPDGDWVETRYNSLNQVTKAWTSQNGTETSPAVSNTYDNLNRLSQVSYKTGESVSYTYDLGDNALTQTTNDGANTYTYTYTHDQLNRVMTRNDSLLGYKTFYEYDDASMRKRMYIRPSAGGTNLYDVNYTYDEANRLLSVTDALAAKTASYDYFDIGALKTATNPNGITAHRTLDTLNRLDTLQYKKTATTMLSSLDYTYDVKSSVTQLVRNDTGAGGTSKTFTFGYDNLSRLTSANYGNETVSYTYDKSGNRLTQVSSVDGTTSYTVATNSNQLTYRSLVPEDTDFSTMSYTYDAEGKLTQRSEGTDSDAFTYGFGSQLTQIQKTRGGTLQQTLSYAYDGSGKRVKVTDSRGTRYFLYDGLMPVLELDASKNVTASYLYGADGVVYRKLHKTVNGSAAYEYEYHHKNALGSNIVVTDDDQNVVARYEYDVFGAVRSEVGTSDNPRKFTGKEYESDVKLYYFAARYYDPHIGRFTQRDPAGDGVNWYAYANNNPLRFIDPLGLASRLATEAELETLREAAIFSFGVTNGAALMDFVTIKIGDLDEAEADLDDRGAQGRYHRVLNEIKLYTHNINNFELDHVRLGTFVHELTHAWQDVTGYLNPDESGSPSNNRYESTIYQLYYVQLDLEQMAKAVQQHYLAIHGWGKSSASAAFAWWDNYGGDPNKWFTRQELVDMASSWLYAPLLNMIRQPMIGATTWGGLKGGQ